MRQVALWGGLLCSLGAGVLSAWVPLRPYAWTGDPTLAQETDPDAWVALIVMGAIGLAAAAPAGIFGRGRTRWLGAGLALLHALRMLWLCAVDLL